MVQDIYDKFYRRVPQEQKDRLKRFRSTHPHKHLRVGDATWEYVSCGQGNDTLLLLAGGTGDAEGMVLALAALENEYRLVSPTYPPLATIEQLVKGIAAILDRDAIAYPVPLSMSKWIKSS